MPTIEEPNESFVLGEAHAILCYLCNRHGWTDLYLTNFGSNQMLRNNGDFCKKT